METVSTFIYENQSAVAWALCSSLLMYVALVVVLDLVIKRYKK